MFTKKPSTTDQSNNSGSIARYLFNDKLLIQDLNKPDTVLSFQDLLKKYKITHDQLPNIQTLELNLTGEKKCYQSLYSFLIHDKIFKLFNLESSIWELGFAVRKNLIVLKI